MVEIFYQPVRSSKKGDFSCTTEWLDIYSLGLSLDIHLEGPPVLGTYLQDNLQFLGKDHLSRFEQNTSYKSLGKLANLILKFTAF